MTCESEFRGLGAAASKFSQQVAAKFPEWVVHVQIGGQVTMEGGEKILDTWRSARINGIGRLSCLPQLVQHLTRSNGRPYFSPVGILART